MKTTTKLYLLLIVLFGGFIAFLVILGLNRNYSQSLLQDSFEKYEQRLFSHILQLNKEKISNPLNDNSTWDATIKYINKPDKRFEKECLNTLLQTFSINHIWFFNLNGERLFYVNDSNSINIVQLLPSTEIRSLLTTTSPFCHFFCLRENRLFEIFGATITSSFDIKHKESPRGYLFFAKTWDSTFINYLARASGSKVTTELSDSGLIQAKDHGRTVVYFDLQDINHKTLGRVKVENEILFQSKWDNEFFLTIVFSIIIGFLGIIIIRILLHYWITKPLNAIKHALDSGAGGTIQRLQSSPDEFGKIARLIINTFKLKEDLKKEVENREITMKRFKLAAQSARFGIWEWDIKNDHFFWDDYVLEIFETAKEEVQADDKCLFAKMQADESLRLKKELSLAVQGVKELASQYRIFLPNNNLRFVDFRGIVTRDASGDPLTVSGICHDITEQKHSLEVIRASEEKFRLLSENISDVIWTMDITGHFIYVSPSVNKLLGFTPKELMALTFDEMLTVSSAQLVHREFLEITESVRSGKAFEQRTRILEHRCKDGSNKWVEISVQGVFDQDSQFMFLLGVTRDVTLRKHIEEDLRLSETRFRQIAESSSDFIWEVDTEGLYTYCSDKIQDILGYSSGEVVGKKHFYDFFAQEIREELKAGAFSAFSRNEVIRNFVNTNIHKNGHQVILETNGIPMCNDKGELNGYRGTDRDITLRQNALLRLETNEKALKVAKEKAEESSRLKSSLLMNMSHELRTPLNGIMGFSGLLRDVLTDTEQRTMAEVILISGKRLMATLNSIIDLSQIESSQTKAELETMDIGSLAEEFIADHQPMLERKRIQFVESINKKVYARVDPRLFNNILFHLVDNAIKYTDEGSVYISVKKEIKPNESYAVIKVKDTGIGISEEQLGYIFEAFRQGDEGLGRQHEGSGLGLTLCQRFTALMGGEIGVESKLGVGSTFILRFPLAKESPKIIEALPVEAGVLDDVPGSEKPRVLIVEDNQANSDLMAIYLNDQFLTDQTYNGKQAATMAFLNNYDIILMDINLGQGMDGIEAAKEIRRIDRYNKIPVIAVTGYSTDIEKQQILSQGFNDFLLKPFDKKGLIEVVVRALRKV